MTELFNAPPPLSDGYTKMFKTIFTWMNNHPKGEICSSDLKEFRGEYNVNPGLLDSILTTLTEKKYLRQVAKASRFRQGSEVFFIAGEEEDVWTFGEFAFDFAHEHGLLVERHQVPAADRFVSATDNQIDTSQAISALDELAEAIRTSNDLTADPQDKIQISREINFLKQIIEQPRIHVCALWDGVNNHTFQWLMKDAVSGIIRAAASKVFGALTVLLSHLIRH